MSVGGIMENNRKLNWILISIIVSSCASPYEIMASPATSTLAAPPQSINDETIPEIEYICPPMVVTRTSDARVDGDFLLTPVNLEDSPYLLNGITAEKKYFPNAENFFINELRISPNRQWLAYLT